MKISFDKNNSDDRYTKAGLDEYKKKFKFKNYQEVIDWLIAEEEGYNSMMA